MRFLMAIMAMTLFAVSVGCEKPAETTPETPATEAPAEGSDAKTDGSASTNEVPDGKKLVSLKLPGMT